MSEGSAPKIEVAVVVEVAVRKNIFAASFFKAWRKIKKRSLLT
jgi:hypothetical protein